MSLFAFQNITLAGGKPVVAENRVNALVGGFRTIDDDLSQTFTYTLLSDANGKFKVSRLKVKLLSLHIRIKHKV